MQSKTLKDASLGHMPQEKLKSISMGFCVWKKE